MKIDNLLGVADGILQNIPSVDHIESIQIDPLHVKRGDLFLDIHSSTENQKCAIQNGAYAIITEHIEEIFDKEIAWIEVDSLRLTCVKLARYEFVRKSCKILYLNDIDLEIFQSIIKNKEYKTLPGNAFSALLILNRSGEKSNFICCDKRLAFSIDPLCKELKDSYNINILESKSPFYSSFILEDKFYENIKIPSLYADRLSLVLKYLDSKKLKYNLQNINLKEHFGAVFVDYKLTKQEFGQGERVLIFESNMDHINKEYRYLKNFTKETILFIPLKFKNYLGYEKEALFFKNIDELKEKIQNSKFKYALILSNYDKYKKLTKEIKKEQLTLF